jgi:small neutral amino acid transporter SnatA (MarC family)
MPSNTRLSLLAIALGGIGTVMAHLGSILHPFPGHETAWALGFTLLALAILWRLRAFWRHGTVTLQLFGLVCAGTFISGGRPSVLATSGWLLLLAAFFVMILAVEAEGKAPDPRTDRERLVPVLRPLLAAPTALGAYVLLNETIAWGDTVQLIAFVSAMAVNGLAVLRCGEALRWALERADPRPSPRL